MHIAHSINYANTEIYYILKLYIHKKNTNKITALTRFTLWDAEILGPSIPALFFYSTSTALKLFLLKTCFQNFSRTASLPIQPFMLWSRCQLSNELSQNIATGRQIIPASSPLTKPTFLFPFGPQKVILHPNSSGSSFTKTIILAP